ncbi:MAG: isoleucine--tRNA ligase [Deltaproteobacteria bacterium]|nr:MAG: isoleucine--tRNA ligase [Deltaproteobacteria bacterium]
MTKEESIQLQINYPEREEDVLKFWDTIFAFEQSLEIRKDSSEYIVYDGPPFATGLPHYGHFVSSMTKDIIPRYWTMQGKLVKRRFGWDTHGVPIEMEVEKDLNLKGPSQIRKYGITEFNEECRRKVLRYAQEWEHSIRRLGRWVDFRNNYKTMDKPFMETIWWLFHKLWKKGLFYKDFRVMPYSWRLSTPLSNFEAGLDYRLVKDLSIVLKFKLKNSNNTYLLVWTTTPWTIPANLAIAIRRDLRYVKVKLDNSLDQYIIEKTCLNMLKTSNFSIVETFLGQEIEGAHYEPIFDYYKGGANRVFQVIHGDHVSTDMGTGLVHLAPAYGQDDFIACKKSGIPFWGNHLVDEEGNLLPLNLNIKLAEPFLINEFIEKGCLYSKDKIEHSYPYCWRSGTPLIYRAIPSWFLKVDNLKDSLIENNKRILWVPEDVGRKRFGNWLENAQDWCVSRNRFWGTPIPLWECKTCQHIKCIQSISQLEALASRNIEDLHPHFVDLICFSCEKCLGTMYRIPEVLDCWFESGAMPYAQSHYPFENSHVFKYKFPADFISEGLDQTRAWFYTLLILSTAVLNEIPFRNVVVSGLVLDKNGNKMSKSRKNYPDPLLIIKEYGADALRAYFLNSSILNSEPLKFDEKGVKDMKRLIILPICNSLSFFIQYIKIDQCLILQNNHLSYLDKWILSKMQNLILEINIKMKRYELYKVVSILICFIDDLTNWYIRRNRRRFWREALNLADKLDKEAAYFTLYSVLKSLSKLIAPFFPFLSEILYQGLIDVYKEPQDKKSVHFCDYPTFNSILVEEKLETEIEIIRKAVNVVRILRERAKVKVKQPLGVLWIITKNEQFINCFCNHVSILEQELNIKQIIIQKEFQQDITNNIGESFDVKDSNLNVFWMTQEGIDYGLLTNLTPSLIEEGLVRETLSVLQKLRKNMKLEVSDRIMLKIGIESEFLMNTLKSNEKLLKDELLAVKILWDTKSIVVGQDIKIGCFFIRAIINKLD